MNRDDVLNLVYQNEVVQADSKRLDETDINLECNQREFLMFAALRELLRANGYSEFEADEMASDVMCQLR
ncbi:hypothetical protein [Burkholderia oklahomensis]|uniref:Uncharacterized protein n=2 Tax=Burkholderia oklahomensis TaxID=342113 RepID=A0AAI8BET2_9BURK|nr:hypothetical protein [Burkholderia oklahomensis]AIO70931.1 hypothetical protein DM82_5556 [Burkholderia oklahomensis]AJX35661.1 hypothetical protein BG90_5055 [Burkholderia oklahomensis C6786]SUY27171.1 Uncharacterised protein [Burkholderia oklahomensis]